MNPPENFDTPEDWCAIAQELEQERWRRLIVLGATDSGKSSFCRFLLSSLGGGFLLDSDLGQKMVGPPGCVTLGTADGDAGLQLSRLYFVGDMTPVGHAAPLLAGIARLARGAASRLVVNTSGLVGGPGIPIKRAKIDALEPDFVIALQRGEELEPILRTVPSNRLLRIHPSSQARRKSAALRLRNRTAGLKEALGPLRLTRVAGAVIEDLVRAPPPPATLRLCGLADKTGEDFALGLIRLDKFAEQQVLWTACDPRQVWRIRIGAEVARDLGP